MFKLKSIIHSHYSLIDFLVLLPVLWMTTGMFWFPKGASYMGALCLVSVFVALYKYKMMAVVCNIKENKFLWILFVYLIYAVISYCLHGYGSRELKALFFAFVFLLFFPRHKASIDLLIVFFVIGLLGVCVTAVYQYYFLNFDRISGFINPITYAVFIVIGCFIVFIYLFYYEIKNTQAILFIIVMLGLVAFLLTGARGVFLAALITLCIFLGFYLKPWERFKKPTLIVFFLVFSALLVLIFPSIKKRVETTNHEIMLVSKGKLYSSIGLRFQMWESAYRSWWKSPLVGLGDGYLADMNAQYHEGLTTRQFFDHEKPHYHNQFIDKYMKNGLIGLILLLALLGYPLHFALKIPDISFHKLGIISTVSILAVCGLTDVPLNHAHILYCYLFLMSYLLVNER